MSDKIKTHGVHSTSLTKRRTVKQTKDDFQTRIFRTYHIPFRTYKKRKKNRKRSIFGKFTSEKLSYLNFDIPYIYKRPDYWNELKEPIDNKGKMMTDDEQDEMFLKTVKEVYHYPEDQMSRILPVFNGISIEDWITHCDDTKQSNEEDVFDDL